MDDNLSPEEKVEMPNIPPDSEVQPLSFLQALLMVFLLFIPLANICFLLHWSFGRKINHNKKNIARAVLLLAVLAFIVVFLSQRMLGKLN